MRIVIEKMLGALRWLVTLLIVLMMGVTCIDVFGRFLLNKPLFGSAEMIQALLAISVFAGLALAAAKDDHIAVDLFVPRIQKRLPRIQKGIVNGLSVIALVLISIELFQVALDALDTGKTTIVLEWPIAAIAFPSSAFCALAALLQIFKGNSAHD